MSFGTTSYLYEEKHCLCSILSSEDIWTALNYRVGWDLKENNPCQRLCVRLLKKKSMIVIKLNGTMFSISLKDFFIDHFYYGSSAIL